MQCDQIRESFSQCQEAPEHIQGCAECRQEWEIHQMLRQFKAPQLDSSFDLAVLSRLEQRGHFAPPTPNWWEKLAAQLSYLLPRAAVLACLLLLFWLGNLASTSPSPELRALRPDRARLWTSLPDAVPPPAYPGAGPDRVHRPLVQKPKEQL